MIKICVLGNSHAGSLKLGWNNISSDFPEYELTFFAARGNNLHQVSLSNGALIPKNSHLEKSIAFTSGGLKLIELDCYDAFVIYGLNFFIPKIDSRISSAVLSTACQHKLASSTSFKLAQKIRTTVNSAIYIGHSPQEAHTADSTATSKNISYNLFFEKTKEILDFPNTFLIKQPSETFFDEWSTKPEYTTGSRKLDIGDSTSGNLHSEDDTRHMNGKFGELWLRALFDQMVKNQA